MITPSPRERSRVSAAPSTILFCVAVGTGLALEHMDILRDSLEEP
jgi:hypothetical protein